MTRTILATTRLIVTGVLIHTAIVHGTAVCRTWIAGEHDLAIAKLAVGRTTTFEMAIDRSSRVSVTAELPDASGALGALTPIPHEHVMQSPPGVPTPRIKLP